MVDDGLPNGLKLRVSYLYYRIATATAEEKNRLTNVISTKLSIEDYNALQIVTNQAYRDGSIKEPTKSEFLRFVITLMLSGLRNMPWVLPILQNQKI